MLPTLKFAVVREDPRVEDEVLARYGCRRPLVVASGGCTALSLAARGDLEVCAFDLNPAQLAHLTTKRDAALRNDLDALNVEADDPGALNQRGAFEGLFRVLRRFVEEFVAGPAEIGRWFSGVEPAESAIERALASPYWPAAFATTFNEPFLHAMFGPAATQHAEPGSYPAYFRRVFERGLRRSDARDNPFLHHVFLGRYLRRSLPPYLSRAPHAGVELHQGTLLDVPDLARFDLFSLSNIFDWSDDEVVVAWAERLKRDARPGSALVLRQLNNQRPLRAFFAPHFRFDDALGRALYERDRSLFYERIEIGVRV